jgi:hypothetical protein
MASTDYTDITWADFIGIDTHYVERTDDEDWTITHSVGGQADDSGRTCLGADPSGEGYTLSVYTTDAEGDETVVVDTDWFETIESLMESARGYSVREA